MDNIRVLLDYIEAELEKGKRSILGRVNYNDIFNYIMQIREELDEIGKGNYVQNEVQKAQNILAMAEQRQEKMISETEIVKKANAEADEIVRVAREQNERMRRQLIGSSLNMLNEMEERINVALDSVHKAIDTLTRNSQQ